MTATEAASFTLLAIMLIILALLIWMRIKQKKVPMGAIFVQGGLSIVLAAVVVFVFRGEDYNHWQTLKWQPLVPEQIPQLVSEGKTVLVDITSNWCSTCQQNKARVWQREQVTRALDKRNIVLMRGDWSLPNPVVERYLTAQGHSGVPYNRVYSPAHPEGIVLPRELNVPLLLSVLPAG